MGTRPLRPSLRLIAISFSSLPGAAYLRAVLQRGRKIIGAHNSRR